MDRLSPEVLAFALAMERKLRVNDDKKGVRGWKHCTAPYLLSRAQNEMKEIAAARKACFENNTPATRRALVGKCADVANFCMMLADTAGDLMAPMENDDAL